MMQSPMAVIKIVNDNFLENPEKFEICFQQGIGHKSRNIDQVNPKLAVVTIIDDPSDGGWIYCVILNIVCCYLPDSVYVS